MESEQNTAKGPSRAHEALHGLDRGSRGTWGWTALLGLGGLVSLGAAAAVIFSSSLGHDAAWIALKLERAGVVAGDFLVTGAVSLSLAAICGTLGRVCKSSRRVETAVGGFGEMESGLASLRTRVSRLHLEITSLQESTKTLLRVAQDQAGVQAAGMQIDAIYRLAASMDQLGQRIEDQLHDQHQSLDGYFDDLTGTVRETREKLDVLVTSGPSSLLADMSQGEDEPLHEPEAILPEPDDGEDLCIEITLDGIEDDCEGWEEISVDPSSFDWGAPPDPDDARPPSEEDCISPIDAGLGLLDELDDEGSPIDDGYEPPSLIPELDEDPVAETQGELGEVMDPDPEAEDGPSTSDPNVAGGRDPLQSLLSEEVLQEALENARRRPID